MRCLAAETADLVLEFARQTAQLPAATSFELRPHVFKW
jgi:hypothetical protein